MNTDRQARIAALKAKINNVPVGSAAEPVDIMSVIGRGLDRTEKLIVEAKPKAIDAWERMQLARLESKAMRLGL